MKAAISCLAGAVAAIVAATVIAANGPAATCSAAQKTQRQAAAATYRRSIPAERQAYFRAHRNAKLRAAFVKRQQAKLKALQRAAACTVPAPPPLPPSSNESCSFMLAQNESAARLERDFGSPFLNEGPITADGSLPSLGETHAVMLFVDFPNHPASEDAGTIALNDGPELGWFKEVSYGRFSLTVTPVLKWFRMPRPSTDYPDWNTSPNARTFLADAIAAADAEVNFAQFQFVYVFVAQGFEQFGNPAWAAFPGHGVAVDGTEIRHATMISADGRRSTSPQFVSTHEFVHSLGLPDIYVGGGDIKVGDTSLVGEWDPMSLPRRTELLAWHRWRLHWLDPSQLTCLQQPGQLEETLTPLETPGGKKMIVVPTSASTAYVAEVRRPIGFDSGICHGGVLVYTVDSQTPNAGGAIALKPAIGLCQAPYDLGPGQVSTFEDAAVKIELLQTDGSGYRIRVTRK